jgi:tetratricopeptide (TPR) repeat protein
MTDQENSDAVPNVDNPVDRSDEARTGGIDAASLESAGEEPAVADADSGSSDEGSCAAASSVGRGSRRAGWILLVVAVVIVAAGMAAVLLRSPPLPEGLSPDEYSEAAEKFRSLYDKEPDRLDVISVAAELAVAEGRMEDAVACFAVIPNGHPGYGPSARLQEGHLLLELDRAQDAEDSLRAFLSLAVQTPNVRPVDVYAARTRLAFILSVELRIEERQALLASAHESGIVDNFNSKQYFFPHLLIFRSKTGSHRLDQFLKVDPNNPRLRLARARYLTAQGELDESLAELKKLDTEKPGDLAVAAAMLECHFEADDWDQFGEFLKSVSDYRIGEPWLLTRMRGHFAMEQGQWEEAVTHFEQVLAADRANPAAQIALVKAYGHLGQTEKARAATDRSATIAKIRVDLGNDRGLKELATDCEKIGMPDAAAVFRRHAETMTQEALKSFQSRPSGAESGL